MYSGGTSCPSAINRSAIIPNPIPVAKKSRGGRMTAAKKRAAKSPGGKGPVAKRPAGRRIMKT